MTLNHVTRNKDKLLNLILGWNALCGNNSIWISVANNPPIFYLVQPEETHSDRKDSLWHRSESWTHSQIALRHQGASISLHRSSLISSPHPIDPTANSQQLQKEHLISSQQVTAIAAFVSGSRKGFSSFKDGRLVTKLLLHCEILVLGRNYMSNKTTSPDQSQQRVSKTYECHNQSSYSKHMLCKAQETLFNFFPNPQANKNIQAASVINIDRENESTFARILPNEAQIRW